MGCTTGMSLYCTQVLHAKRGSLGKTTNAFWSPSRDVCRHKGASQLHFFWIPRAFSFLISLASSPISLQYSLNLSSES